MPDHTQKRIRVDCTECYFSRIVEPEDGVVPAEVVVDHGRERGHKLSTTRLDE